jgi:hypothetical protein
VSYHPILNTLYIWYYLAKICLQALQKICYFSIKDIKYEKTKKSIAIAELKEGAI